MYEKLANKYIGDKYIHPNQKNLIDKMQGLKRLPIFLCLMFLFVYLVMHLKVVASLFCPQQMFSTLL